MKLPDGASTFLNVFAAMASMMTAALIFWGIMPKLSILSNSQESLRQTQIEQAQELKKLAQDNSRFIAKSKADLEGVAKAVKQIKEDQH